MKNFSITSAFAISLCSVVLPGCVDLGKVGMHPQSKIAYFNVSSNQLGHCLEAEFLRHDIFTDEDTPYSDGDKRYDLRKDNQLVGWLDISDHGHRQSSASVYYGKNEKWLEAIALSAFQRCDVR